MAATALASPSSRKKPCVDMNFSSVTVAMVEATMKMAFITLLAAMTRERFAGCERCCMMAFNGTA